MQYGKEVIIMLIANIVSWIAIAINNDLLWQISMGVWLGVLGIICIKIIIKLIKS